MNAFSLLRIELKPSKYMVALYTIIYLMSLHLINYLFRLDVASMAAMALVSVFYFIQMISYARKHQYLEMPVSQSRPERDQLPSLSLNDQPYKVLPQSILTSNYIMLELAPEFASQSRLPFISRWKMNKQLMIFPDQCRRSEFHTLIRMIRLSLQR